MITIIILSSVNAILLALNLVWYRKNKTMLQDISADAAQMNRDDRKITRQLRRITNPIAVDGSLNPLFFAESKCEITTDEIESRFKVQKARRG